MTAILANPWGLLALLSLPVVYWLHRYVIVSERREVSNVALWADADEVRGEGQTPLRPPLTWVLVLELLAALAFSLWLAGLDVRMQAARAERVALIVDATASMGASSGTTSVRAIDTVVDELQPYLAEHSRSTFTLILAGAVPEAHADLSLSELRQRLAEYTPYHGQRDITAALAVAETLQVLPEATLVFSDDAELQHTRLIRLGAPAPNTAIVNADWPPGGVPFVSVRQFGGGREVEVITEVDGVAQQPLRVNLSSGQEAPLNWQVPTHAKLLRVRLSDDALAIDNEVTLVRPPRRQVRIALEDPRPELREALRRLIAAIPLLEESGAQQADLVVAANPALAHTPAQLSFVQGPDSTLQLDLNLDPFSPLTQGVPTHGLVWYAAPAQPSAAARVLLASSAQPLLWQTPGQLTLAVDLEKSNLLSHAALPVLLFNLTEALDQAAGGLQRHNFRQGELVHVERAKGWTGAARVTHVDREIATFPAPAAIALGRVWQPGLYQLEVGELRQPIAVNLLNTDESDLSSRVSGGARPPLRASLVDPIAQGSTFRALLLVLGALLLFGAWRLLGGKR